MNDVSERDKKYLTRSSIGNGNGCKIWNKISDSRKTSAEKTWVNIIEYLIVSIQYDYSTLKNVTT